VSEPLRIGVLGAGAIAQVAHLVVLGKLEGVRVAGICDTDVAKAHALAGRFRVPEVYDDIEDLLHYTKPDAVVVCTPNHLHEVHAISSLSAGIPVLCERPLALTSAGVERVMAAQQAAGVPVVVGMNHRFRHDVQTVRSFLLGGELGALCSVRAYWHIFRPAGTPVGWRGREAESGGGAMLDLGLPLLDLALWLAECPAAKRVSAVFGGQHRRGTVEDLGSAFLQCTEGHSIFVDVSWRHMGPHEKFTLEVVGETGSAAIAPLAVFKEMHGTPVNVTPAGEEPGDQFSNSYRAEWDRFLAVVRGDEPTPTLTDQLLLHRTLDAVYRSAREAREVSL
jgi:predicted dehydrogenase